MSGFIKKNMDASVVAACDITKKWLEKEPEIKEITSMIVQTSLFNKFLGAGRQIANAVAERHPEFHPVAQMMKDNTASLVKGDPDGKILSKELDSIVPFYASADWYDEPDFVSLLLAYIGWGFKYRKEEIDERMQEFFCSINRQESLSDGAWINLIMAMWFWNYEGFQDRVMTAVSKDTITAAKPSPTGYIQTSMDDLEMLAINLAKEEGTDFSQASIEGALYLSWLGKRYGVSQVIAAKHPVFTAFVKQIETDDLVITNPASSSDEILGTIQQEAFKILEYKQQEEALAKDVDFVSLQLAFSCWMLKDAKEEYEKDIMPLFAVLDSQRELSPASMLNLIASMWFWNYDNFQDRVMQRLSDIVNQYQEELQKEQEKRQEHRRRGVCQYCGGAFKGLLSKKCSVCGRSKDY